MSAKYGEENTIGRYPDFYDAMLDAEFRTDGEGGPEVVFKYYLIGEDGRGISRTATRRYGIYDPVQQVELAVDLRRLGYELPYDIGDLPRVVDEISLNRPLVEVLILNNGLHGEPDVVLVRRY